LICQTERQTGISSSAQDHRYKHFLQQHFSQKRLETVITVGLHEERRGHVGHVRAPSMLNNIKKKVKLTKSSDWPACSPDLSFIKNISLIIKPIVQRGRSGSVGQKSFYTLTILWLFLWRLQPIILCFQRISKTKASFFVCWTLIECR